MCRAQLLHNNPMKEVLSSFYGRDTEAQAGSGCVQDGLPSQEVAGQGFEPRWPGSPEATRTPEPWSTTLKGSLYFHCLCNP